jgi:IS605 OrfB family transposase
MLVQSSAVRSAYQFMRRTGHVTNEVKKHVKTRYMADLNQRYVSDACGIAAQMRDKPSVIFGGKKAWKNFQSGELAKEDWQQRRNSLLYSRGDKTKKGNPNIRVVKDKILINDPAARGLWIEGKFWMPAKFKPNWSCYDVRLKWVGEDKFKVSISWDELAPHVITTSPSNGTIGVDCNPDGVALVEVNSDGNLLDHRYEKEQRIQFACEGKRTYDVRQLAIQVVDYAVKVRKPLVLEELRFWGGKQRGAKFQRMKHNFLHRRILDAIKSRAASEGVEAIEVNPAFTSVLGLLKYAGMYSLNRHTAAALVIARRGMEIKERQTFTDTLQGRGGSRVKLEARSRNHALKPKAWSWMKDSFLRPKNSRAHSPVSGSSNPAGTGDNSGEIPGGESGSTTGQSRHPTAAKRSDANGE